MAKRICLDSAAILSFLIRESGRGEVMKAALRLASTTDSSITLHVSVVSLVEVAYIAEPNETLETGFEIVDEFWNTSPIHLIDAHAGIADTGKRLIRSPLMAHSGPELPNVRKRAADLLHLATAIWLEADEFWTYDVADFQRYPQTLVKVCEPHVDHLMLEGLI